MPYIKKEAREFYDSEINAITSKLKNISLIKAIGRFVYIIYKIALGITQKHFWCMAMIIGGMLCAILEYYRRVVVKHEKIKIEENGDVY